MLKESFLCSISRIVILVHTSFTSSCRYRANRLCLPVQIFQYAVVHSCHPACGCLAVRLQWAMLAAGSVELSQRAQETRCRKPKSDTALDV
jgi:hypothetical protein